MYKLGCKAAMQERGDDTLEGAHSFVALLEANLPHFGVFFFKFSQTLRLFYNLSYFEMFTKT